MVRCSRISSCASHSGASAGRTHRIGSGFAIPAVWLSSWRTVAALRTLRTSGRVIADEVDVLTDEAFLGRAQRLTGVGQLPVRAGRRVRQFIRTRVEGCRLAQARVEALQLLAQLTLAGPEQLGELAGLGPED